MLWKDGGPVIGVQIENEYSARGPGKGAEHILTLLRAAREAGLDAPFYSVTGWDSAAFPARDVIPVFGGYPEGFWYRSVADLPPSVNYFFTTIRCQENVGEDLRPSEPAIDAQYARFPFFTAEMGGGMEVSYHRRPVMRADDVAATLVTKLGSGVNLYGYYMFHGGTNPEGKRTTLQESQETGGPNDLPLATYDFQAPLGEFGQVRDSFRTLKSFHLFLRDFGSYLAPMTPFFPDIRPTSQSDRATPRVAVRARGRSGFVFLNNHQRLYPLPPQRGLRFAVKTASATVEFPRRPVDVPSGAYFIWPFNLDLEGSTLSWATAQLLSKLDQQNAYFFFAWPGIAPELAFDASTIADLEAPGATITRDSDRVYVSGLTPSTRAAVTLRSKDGRTSRIVVLSREEAEHCWKATVDGRERLFFSPADLYFQRDSIHVRARNTRLLSFSVFPASDSPPRSAVPVNGRGDDGVFRRYDMQLPSRTISVQWEQRRAAGPSAPVRMGKEVAMAPAETAFELAGVWRIQLPKDPLAGVADVFLHIEYVGDVGRIYAGGRLLTDDFYRGAPWEIGLKRLGKDALAQELELKILPLRRDAPVYIQQDLRPVFPPSGESARVKSITAEPEYEVEVDFGGSR